MASPGKVVPNGILRKLFIWHPCESFPYGIHWKVVPNGIHISAKMFPKFAGTRTGDIRASSLSDYQTTEPVRIVYVKGKN